MKPDSPHIEGNLDSRDRKADRANETATAKSTKIGVSRPAVERAEMIKRADAGLAEKVAQRYAVTTTRRDYYPMYSIPQLLDALNKTIVNRYSIGGIQYFTAISIT